MKDIELIKNKFRIGEYAVSDHAIMEARKDGIEPATVKKLEWTAINGEVIEEYLDLTKKEKMPRMRRRNDS